MINSQMKLYNYSLYGDVDDYGMSKPIDEIQGQLRIAINITSQSVQDNINFTHAEYIGLTHDKNISDKYIVHYGDKKLKVLYIQPHGRYKQVYLGAV